MSEYTPTTDEIRDEYVTARYNAYVPECGWGVLGDRFDRWLAVHDAQVRSDG